ncbi:hypothetical protein TRFO_28789 [Tritrichomonas foetus]|uniref:Cyclic nucleotide-binding domain-containing protein n=1 Tax=Tritrichomonas foetus TaxID=1144522 RepID=A0A1J4K2C1_9EUKA|nr:hypothetical protein TRFO_28789 [Tritrichomonas foetus]|eukprot:OHT03886.1 hypothetical protein TRFO_28789 [Tritrichomonas foetus]
MIDPKQEMCYPQEPAAPLTTSIMSPRRLQRVVMRPRQSVRQTKRNMYTAALQALYIPPADRTPQMVKAIETCLSTWPDFTHCIHSESERLDVCAEITLQHHSGNTVLFKQGDSPDGWYLVFSGSCSVIINWPDDTYDDQITPERLSVLRFYFGDDSHFRQLAIKGPTQEFGSTALIKSKPRNATIFVNEDSYLLHVDATYYQMSVQWFAKMQMKRRAAFLELIPELKFLEEDRDCFDRLAENLRERTIRKGEVIDKDHPICQGFFCINTGSLLKNFVCDFNHIPKHSDTIKLMDGFEVKYPTSIQNVRSKVYGPKEAIQDPSLKELHGQPFTIIALKETVGYELPMSDLYYLVPFKLREKALDLLLAEPTDQELLHVWMENEWKTIWRMYKHQCSKEAREYMKTERRLTTGNVIGRVATTPKPVKGPQKNRIVIRYTVA